MCIVCIPERIPTVSDETIVEYFGFLSSRLDAAKHDLELMRKEMRRRRAAGSKL